MKPMYIRLLLGAMALYDGLLGAAFLAGAPQMYQRMGISPPNHWGYVHFAAALLVIFGLMFLEATVAPRRNRNLLPYCFLLKLSYSGVVLYHWMLGDGLPGFWKPFAIADLVMAGLIAWIWVALRPVAASST